MSRAGRSSAAARKPRPAVAADVRGSAPAPLATTRSGFLAAMSHELRTPVNSIVGYAELLLSPQAEDFSTTTRRDYAQHILSSARDLQGLIDDLLDVTRLQNGTLSLVTQPCDFAEVAEMAISAQKDLAERSGISLVAHLFSGIHVMGDPLRLRQAVRHLLSNAIKFSPDGSTVSIDMQRAKTGQLVLAIRDSGIGIAPEDVERVFEPFVQGDGGMSRRFGGVGVGLTVARHISELHGGTVSLSSTPGKGTEARLVLPAHVVQWPKPDTPAPAV